jgi:hypothetical protein
MSNTPVNPQLEPSVESAGAPPLPGESEADRRARSDRREKPTSPWAALPPAGQRVKNRRIEEHRQPYFTDRFSPVIFFGVLALIVATLVDATLTLYVLQGGGSEANPVMERLLDHSAEAFVIGKYLLTVIGLPVLLIFRNHYLFGTQLRVGYLIPICVALYAVLISYQIVLIDQRVGW